MPLIRNMLASGGVATLLTALAATIFGRREGQSLAGPVNAISHIAWGDSAKEADAIDLKHTATGLALNASAMVMWAGIQEAGLSQMDRKPTPIEALAIGSALAGVAYVVDYHVVPKRFTPGFDSRLSKSSLAGVYGVLALSFAIGALVREP